MSLEKYREIIQAGTDGRERVSIIDDFASVMISVGKRGVQDYINSKVDRKRGVLNIDDDFIQGLVQEHSEDLGTIELGVDIVAVRNSLVERRFCVNEYIDFWNSHAGNFPFMSLSRFSEDKIEDFTPEKWRKMIVLAKSDPSLASFFESKNRHLLPVELNKMLSNGITYPLLMRVLPSYKEAMDELVERIKSPNKQELMARKVRLEDYDGVIRDVQGHMDTILDAKFGWVLGRELQSSREVLSHTLKKVDTELSY